MDFDSIIDNISPETYEALKRASELGKWPDGKVLTKEQKAQVLEAIIAYGQRNLDPTEQVGYIDRGSKQQDETCDSEPQPVVIKH